MVGSAEPALPGTIVADEEAVDALPWAFTLPGSAKEAAGPGAGAVSVADKNAGIVTSAVAVANSNSEPSKRDANEYDNGAPNPGSRASTRDT